MSSGVSFELVGLAFGGEGGEGWEVVVVGVGEVFEEGGGEVGVCPAAVGDPCALGLEAIEAVCGSTRPGVWEGFVVVGLCTRPLPPIGRRLGRVSRRVRRSGLI